MKDLIARYVTSGKAEGFKLHQKRFILDVKNNFFAERAIRNLKILVREVVELPSLEVFKRHVVMALKDMIQQYTSDVSWMVGLDVLGLSQTKPFYDFVILSCLCFFFLNNR